MWSNVILWIGVLALIVVGVLVLCVGVSFFILRQWAREASR
jgi:hypothetical protein